MRPRMPFDCVSAVRAAQSPVSRVLLGLGLNWLDLSELFVEHYATRLFCCNDHFGEVDFEE